MLSLCCRKVTSVMSDSVWPHRWQPTRLPCPWDSPGKNTGVGCHFLLQCCFSTRLQLRGQFLLFSWNITWSPLYFGILWSPLHSASFLGPGMGTLDTTQEFKFIHRRLLLNNLVQLSGSFYSTSIQLSILLMLYSRHWAKYTLLKLKKI